MAYADLHEHIARLERAGLLHRIDHPVDKDSELHPLVRWQYRGGIAERDRKAFLFTNVVDAKGRRYDHFRWWSAPMRRRRKFIGSA